MKRLALFNAKASEGDPTSVRYRSGREGGRGGPRNTGHGEVPLAKDERSPGRFGLIRTLADDGRVLA